MRCPFDALDPSDAVRFRTLSFMVILPFDAGTDLAGPGDFDASMFAGWNQSGRWYLSAVQAVNIAGSAPAFMTLEAGGQVVTNSLWFPAYQALPPQRREMWLPMPENWDGRGRLLGQALVGVYPGASGLTVGWNADADVKHVELEFTGYV